MKPDGFNKKFGCFALSALVAGSLVMACQTSDNSHGNDKGGTGGSDEGGSGGSDEGGSDGSDEGGNGGSDEGGSGGSDEGGKGGMAAGGSGGTAMMGGMGGSMMSAAALPWCNSTTAKPAVNDGVIMGASTAGEPFAANAPTGEERMVAGSTAYVPKQYDSAAEGKVGLLVLLPSYSLSVTERRGLDQAIHAGHIPPVVVAKTGDKNSVVAMIAALQAALPKISKDPAWIGVGGQSTAGAEAFDVVWNNPMKAGVAVVGSGSFVCFMGSQADQNSRNNDVYVQRISAAAKKNIRVSLSVGTCDIFSDLAERITAECSNCSTGACVDASQCRANWQKVNENVAAALQAKGYNYQLQIMTRGQHQTPTQPSFLNQVRWMFKPMMCQ